MCTNRALVNSLECYMEDLVENFEDFVKKSLILISVAVVSVVVMLLYMLKVVSERTGTADSAADPRGQPLQQTRSTTSIRRTPSNAVKRDFLLRCEPKVASVSVNTLPMSPVPSFDEQVLREGSFNCEKNCDLKSRSMRTDSLPRRSISSLPTCVSISKRTPGTVDTTKYSTKHEGNLSIITSVYTHNNRRLTIPEPHANPANETSPDLARLTAMAAKYFWTAYSSVHGSYVAIATVFLIVFLSFILPDLSQKIHRTSELKDMKKVLNMVSKEVSKAEVACLTVADEICSLHCSMHDGTTETEVTIMSYLYTDSFDAYKTLTDSSTPSEF